MPGIIRRQSMTEAPTRRVLAIEGMTCTGCVTAVTRALSRVPAVSHVEVDLVAARAHITGAADPAALLAAIEQAGFSARAA
jgi:copper chaperone CopZ